MKSGDYATAVPGFRLIRREKRPPDGTIWFFQTEDGFSKDSARRLFAELPDDFIISFVERAIATEGWLFVRHDGDRCFVKRGHGVSPWNPEAIEQIMEWFMASPLVSNPLGVIESFTVSSMPEHLRDQHLNESLD
jgi:hypothetical protein